MNDLVRPSSLFATGVRAAAPGGVAGTVAHPPPEAARLAAGTILRGVVVGADNQGHVVVRTELGDLSVATKAPLARDSEVTLQVRSTGAQLHILLMPARGPMAAPAAGLGHEAVRADLSSSGAPQGPAAAPPGGPAAPVDHLTIGQTVRAIFRSPAPLPLDLAANPGVDPSALRALSQLAPGSKLTLRVLAASAPPQSASVITPPPGPVAGPPAGQGPGGPSGSTAAPAAAGGLAVPSGSAAAPLAGPVPTLTAAPTGRITAPGATQPTSLTAAPTALGHAPPGGAPAAPAGGAGASTIPGAQVSSQTGGISPPAPGAAGAAVNRAASAPPASANAAAAPGLVSGPGAISSASRAPQTPPAGQIPPGSTTAPASPSPTTASGVPVAPVVPATTASLSPTVDGGVRFAAVVTQVTSSGSPVLATPLGTVALETQIALPQGGTLTLELPRGGWRTELAQGPAPAAVSTLTHGWPALEDAQAILQELAGPGARAMADAIPQPGGRLASGILFVLAALSGGQIDRWLGAQPLKALQAAGKDSLAARLGQDFAQMSRLGDAAPGEWRLLPIPVWDGQAARPVRLFLRQHDEPGGGAGRGESDDATRFVLEVEMSRLGGLQLDGLVRDKRFDLIFRSRKALPEAMRQRIRDIFQGANEAAGYTGQIGFQASRDWKPMPVPGDPAATSSPLVV